MTDITCYLSHSYSPFFFDNRALILFRVVMPRPRWWIMFSLRQSLAACSPTFPASFATTGGHGTQFWMMKLRESWHCVCKGGKGDSREVSAFLIQGQTSVMLYVTASPRHPFFLPWILKWWLMSKHPTTWRESLAIFEPQNQCQKPFTCTHFCHMKITIPYLLKQLLGYLLLKVIFLNDTNVYVSVCMYMCV